MNFPKDAPPKVWVVDPEQLKKSSHQEARWRGPKVAVCRPHTHTHAKSPAAKMQILRGEFLLFQFRVEAGLWDAGARGHHMFTVTALTLTSWVTMGKLLTFFFF